MTVSEIKLADVKSRLRIDYDTDDAQLTAIMSAAQSIIQDMTGRTAAEIDTLPQAYHLYMCICQHLYDCCELTAREKDLDIGAQIIINQMKTAEVVLA